jgi:hypothetical protein
MTVTVPQPSVASRYIDQNGRPTIEFFILLEKLKEKLDDHEARLVAGSL